jgi:DMSO/TMAO reductase YedYZ molybdopterin-dependent catalytic subunit
VSVFHPEDRLEESGNGNANAKSTRPPVWVGAICGIVAAGAGLAIGELLAGVWDRWRSPVVVVGDRVIDAVPPAVKDWAIDTFGTSDKVVLIAGTLLIITVVAALAGVWAARGRWFAAGTAVVVFAGAGAAASLGRGSAGPVSVVPSVIAGVVTFGVLRLLGPLAAAGWGPVRTESGGAEAAAALAADRAVSMRALQADSRRRFLGVSAGVAGASVAVAVAGRWLQRQAAVTVDRLKVFLPQPVSPAPPVPPAVSVGVDGVGPFVTPTEDFYRIDTALVVPQIGSDDWTLQITGRVDRPVTLTYDQLLARPMIERVVTIACVSNEVGGDLIGTARWLGCRLDDLLAEAGVQSEADQVVGVSVDGFTAGFPTAVLDGRDALVVVGMNGEPLTAKHGFPARLVVPGLYGYVSATKWLSEIRLTRFDEFEGYWIPRGWAVEGPVLTQSRIDVPRVGATVPAGSPTPVAGVAWSMLGEVTRVEVQVDDGEWREARLGEAYSESTWRQWSLSWTPDPGEHTLRVRTTDEAGETQTAQVTDVAPDGARGWHTIRVRAD